MVRSLCPSRNVIPALMFAFALIGITMPCAARADLVIKGGGAAQLTQILGVYNQQIPTIWKSEAPVPVSLLGDKDMNQYIDRGSGSGQSNDASDDDSIDGIFEDSPSRITLRESITPEDLPFTFAHEYGHYVWQTFLTKSDRSKYSQIYNRQLKAHHLVTDYAATDLDEGFAEAFSFYIVDKALLDKRDSESCQFLDETLNRMSAHKT